MKTMKQVLIGLGLCSIILFGLKTYAGGEGGSKCDHQDHYYGNGPDYVGRGEPICVSVYDSLTCGWGPDIIVITFETPGGERTWTDSMLDCWTSCP